MAGTTPSSSNSSLARASRSSWRIRSRVTTELPADRLQRQRFTVEAKAQLDNAPLALGQLVRGVRTAMPRNASTAASSGSTASPSPKRSPSSFSPVSDRLVQRDRGFDRAQGLLGVTSSMPAASDSSSRVGSRPCCTSKRWRTRDSLDRRSSTCTGIRMVFDWLADRALAGLADPPRGIRGELEALAPVELLAAPLRPRAPSCTRSPSDTPRPVNGGRYGRRGAGWS